MDESQLLLSRDEIDYIEALLKRDLKESIRVFEANRDELNRSAAAYKWDLYMKVLKQSAMPGCVDEVNPYR